MRKPDRLLAIALLVVLTMTGCESSRHRYRRDELAYSAEHVGSTAPASMNNDDVIRLSAAGVSNELILRAVESKGGRFDLSPDGIIQLSQNGVTDDVISAIQEIGEPEPQRIALTSVPAVRPPAATAVIVVAPGRPSPGPFRIGHRPRRMAHGHRHYFH